MRAPIAILCPRTGIVFFRFHFALSNCLNNFCKY
jgi:hypothetical protein